MNPGCKVDTHTPSTVIKTLDHTDSFSVFSSSGALNLPLYTVTPDGSTAGIQMGICTV